VRGWITLLVVAIASALGVRAASAPPPPTPPADPTGAFVQWANQVARAKKLSVCRYGQLRYPGEEPGTFAQLGDPKNINHGQGSWLFARGKERWSYQPEPPGSFVMNVESCDEKPKWEDARTVSVGYRGESAGYIWNTDEVTFVAGEPVTLHEENHDVDGSSEIDWLEATENTVDHDQAEPEPKGEITVGRLIALPPGSRWIDAWKTPTFVPFGAKNRKGAADANLAAYALDMGPAGFQIVIDVTDDSAVPTTAKADARRFVRSDHLEIWWRPDNGSDNRQLGIGFLADGGADVRWLYPKELTEKPPPVRRKGSHFEIDLSFAALGFDPKTPAPGGRWNLPFTVAFSDADDAAGGQQTVVATSPVRWNKRETFGALLSLPNKARRFPSFGTPVDK
jgi:hypothetical protein